MSDATLFRPLVACDAVVFIGNGSSDTLVLLIERKNEPFKGKWAFPGGLLDEGESCEDCVARELKEETGLSGVMLEQLGVWSAPGRDPRGQILSVVYVGQAEVHAKDKICAADDAADARWFRLDEVDETALAFDHRELLDAAKRRLFT